jgi:protein-disulfide isomerase
MTRFTVALWSIWLVAALVACGAAPPQAPAAPIPEPAPLQAAADGQPWGNGQPLDATGDPGPIPVSGADPAWGRPDALVTMVFFADLQCPFTSRAAATIADLQKKYGPDQLRVVWKNLPLPFHKNAAPAADTAMAVYAAGGNGPFWKFVNLVLANQSTMGGSSYDAWVQQAGVPELAVRNQLATGAPSAKVDADAKLAKEVGANGTPTFFLNGVTITGAQPFSRFAEVMDSELKRAQQALAAGASRPSLYAQLATEAFQKPAPTPTVPAAAPEEEDDKATFRVPIGSSPVRGKPTALVTIIEFSDFQCPFCKRVQDTIDEVRKKYGDEVRVVFKNSPLPFHPRAEPAAELAIEARVEKGDAGFFRVHDALFHATKIEDEDLEAIARTAHLDVAKVKKAIAGKKHANAIAEDVDLADEVKAMGTPHFFINGRRLVGAQPIEKFTALIDEELGKAKALVNNGIRRQAVYDELQKSAKAADPPEMKTLPAATSDQPFTGTRDAKVVIVEFADFQCPFCGRVEPTLNELLELYPGKIKIVWRHRPLAFHPDAHLASEAAVEAFRQKGNEGFWAYRTLLFKNQSSSGGLKKKALLDYADQVGLDRARFAAALEDHRNSAAVDADSAVADAAGINGTPAFVVNGVFISGAQPITKFRRVIDRALASKP